MSNLDPIEQRLVRCAIYTRKSTDHGLDAAMNSLEVQRDVCQAYIKCRAHRNWTELPAHYDDGGYSGGTLARPALSQLVSDIEEGKVDVIVVYKIDRLTRSLLDFVRLTDVLQKYGVSFVSVTQAFDTSDSMGRLVLNVLLTFAQFERELSSDRVRDKKASMKRNGLFAGGLPPFGYIVEPGGRLVVDPVRAPIVSWIFENYPRVSGVHRLVTALRVQGIRTRRWRTRAGVLRGGQPVTAAVVRQILRNPIYAGFFTHRGDTVEAKNVPLVTREQWDLAQETRLRRHVSTDPDRNFLLGLLHDEFGRRMSMATAAPGYGRKPRYYRTMRRGIAKDPQKSVFADADEVEVLARATLKAFLIDQQQLRSAVLSLGVYSARICRLLKRGRLSARRIDLMDGIRIRRLFLALVPRAEITRRELRLYVSCSELVRFLAWDGTGMFMKESLAGPDDDEAVRLLTCNADTVCGKRTYQLPIRPCLDPTSDAKPWLVDILKKGTELRTFVLSNRDRSLSELAKTKHLGPSQLSRYIRINYLAPDIQAAIMDGTQPPDLTAWKLLYGPMPMDWAQQRQVLGFV